jgi:hypothetical protein
VPLVDSTVWIDYFNGQATPQTDHLDWILSRQPVLGGILSSRRYSRASAATLIRACPPGACQVHAGQRRESRPGGRECEELSQATPSRDHGPKDQATSCCMPIKTMIPSRSILDCAWSILYWGEEYEEIRLIGVPHPLRKQFHSSTMSRIMMEGPPVVIAQNPTIRKVCLRIA